MLWFRSPLATIWTVLLLQVMRTSALLPCLSLLSPCMPHQFLLLPIPSLLLPSPLYRPYLLPCYRLHQWILPCNFPLSSLPTCSLFSSSHLMSPFYLSSCLIYCHTCQFPSLSLRNKSSPIRPIIPPLLSRQFFPSLAWWPCVSWRHLPSAPGPGVTGAAAGGGIQPHARRGGTAQGHFFTHVGVGKGKRDPLVL